MARRATDVEREEQPTAPTTASDEVEPGAAEADGSADDRAPDDSEAADGAETSAGTETSVGDAADDGQAAGETTGRIEYDELFDLAPEDGPLAPNLSFRSRLTIGLVAGAVLPIAGFGLLVLISDSLSGSAADPNLARLVIFAIALAALLGVGLAYTLAADLTEPLRAIAAAVERGKEIATKQKDSIAAAVEAGREAYQREKSKAQ